ncbi:GNAT domain-containing protein [Aspergillus spinulosporus]
MLLNATTAISTSKVLLVPYSKWHVPRYHEWMKDEEIQQATASEPLSLSEEYAMQQSWRNDADKLTFIICLPVASERDNRSLSLTDEDDSPARMIGDINLFLRVEEDEEDGDEEKNSSNPQIIGEIELMIAEKKDQGKGFGKAALLAFLTYVLEKETEVLGEFVAGDAEAKKVMGKEEVKGLKFGALSVKIGQTNERSLKLFEGLGFIKIGDSPNYFGEWELRRKELDIKSENLRVEGYREVAYERVA